MHAYSEIDRFISTVLPRTGRGQLLQTDTPAVHPHRAHAAWRRPLARSHKTRATGFTLIELVVSMAASAILMGGLFVALYASSQALSPSLASNAIVDAANVVANLQSELQLATAFTERTALSVTFTVADRDADGTDESIRYAWPGTAGQPVTRQYNAGPARTVLDSVVDLNLQYDIITVTQTGSPTPPPKNYVTRVRIELQPVGAAATRIHAAALVLDRPEVTP